MGITFIKGTDASKANKDTDAVSGNLTKFTTGGDIVDSGIPAHLVYPDPAYTLDIQPTLNLDFANQAYRSHVPGTGLTSWPLVGGDSKLTTTRATTATYFDPMGVLRTAAAGVPRIDHDPVTGECLGLLVEEQRANYALHSGNPSNWVLNGASLSGTFIAPTGESVSTVLASTNIEVHRITRGALLGPVGTTIVTYGHFVHIPEGSDVIKLVMRCRAGGNGQAVSVNVTGTGADATFTFASSNPFGTSPPAAVTANEFVVEDYGNGIFRLSVISAIASDATPISTIDTGFSCTTSEAAAGTANTKIGIWGLSIEAGAFPTSYIPTTTAAVTRNADVISMTGTNFSDWYNQSEGAVFCGYSAPVLTLQTLLTISDGTDTDRISLTFTSAGAGAGFLFVKDGGTIQASALPAPISPVSGTPYKLAVAYKKDDFAASRDGGAVATDTSGTIPLVDRLNIGALFNGTPNLNGHIKQLQYYPRRLTNTQLQALSA